MSVSKLYLVTGGAGFIGSHMVELLHAEGQRVRVVDNLSTGKRERLPEGVEFVEADIRNLEKIKPAFEGVDGVFHMAALPNVQASIEEPVETHTVNIDGTFNVIMAAKDAGVKRLIYSASCAAYGEPEESPQHEGLLPCPISPYGLQKYVGEHYTRMGSLFWGLETVSLRYFNVFGPRMSEAGAYRSVITIFLQQKNNGEAMTITGDGEQTRDFVFVTDVVRANWLAMNAGVLGKGEVINIGTGIGQSVNKIANLIGGQKQYIAARIEPKHVLADASRAKKFLDWEPLVMFEEGLEEAKKFFNS